MSLPRAVGESPLHRYSLYGLVLDTPYEMVGLREAEDGEVPIELSAGDSDLFARARSEVNRTGDSCDDDWFRHALLADGSDYLRWSGHFEFLVDREGRHIAYLALDNASLEALHVYLLGQVLSFALLKRGIEPLHATAVLVDGEAVAFIGESGAGKSTLAASFLAAGYPLLTDDLLVLKQHDGRLLGSPGMPRIKLYPEAAKALLAGSAAGIEMNQWTPKRIVPLAAGQYCNSPAPLSAILLLGSGGSVVEIERLASRRAFLELLENTYNPLVDDSRRLRQQFPQLASWAESIPLATLRGPRDLGRVGELRDAVLEYVSVSL